ncbi:hypothetical protein [Mesorhizobium ciceri]|uniref:hypothetical protein n=1 Tax=Mesorhizobium ciceri TaxID=39645 RepID=UPI003B845E9F
MSLHRGCSEHEFSDHGDACDRYDGRGICGLMGEQHEEGDAGRTASCSQTASDGSVQGSIPLRRSWTQRQLRDLIGGIRDGHGPDSRRKCGMWAGSFDKRSECQEIRARRRGTTGGQRLGEGDACRPADRTSDRCRNILFGLAAVELAGN